MEVFNEAGVVVELAQLIFTRIRHARLRLPVLWNIFNFCVCFEAALALLGDTLISSCWNLLPETNKNLCCVESDCHVFMSA